MTMRQIKTEIKRKESFLNGRRLKPHAPLNAYVVQLGKENKKETDKAKGNVATRAQV